MGKKIELTKMIEDQRNGLGLALAVLSEKSGVYVSHKRLQSTSRTGRVQRLAL